MRPTIPHTTDAPPNLAPWFQVALDYEPDQHLNSQQLFGNDHPIEVEVGSGRGLFLVTAATARPETNFLGVEIDYKEGRRAAGRLQRRKLSNARLLGGDAHWVLRHLIAPESVDAVHVYFPDPWWKHKHRKRRVFNDLFVEKCLLMLKPGALFHSWTDVPEYFQVIKGLMDHHPAFEILPPPEEREAAHHMDYLTSYERKARQKGVAIHRGLWQKR